MAARRVSSVLKIQTQSMGDSNNSKERNDSGSGVGTGKKMPAARVVKSRYLQTVDNEPPQKNAVLDESSFSAQKPASLKPGSKYKSTQVSSPRRSVYSQLSLHPISMLSSTVVTSQVGNVLESTALDGHCVRPNFDISAVQEKPMIQNTVDLENEKIMEMQTFLLAYLTAKIESNTVKLKTEAETNLLAVMEEEQKLRKSVQEKKRQYQLWERKRQLNDLVDMQICALTLVCSAAEEFSEQYMLLASAVDTTLHELPVKNISIEGDRKEFLERAAMLLKESEQVLQRILEPQQEEDRSSEILKVLTSMAHEVEEQLSRVALAVQDLSALVSQQNVHVQQCLEEKRIGMSRAQSLYLRKH